jgi:hypothetical protein
MTVHALHVSGRKDQYPSFQILAPEEIDAALPFFSLIGDATGILDFHIDLRAI